MKYLKIFEENKNKNYIVAIIINNELKHLKLFNEKNSVENYLINFLHNLIKEEDKNYLDKINKPDDINELLDLASMLIHNFDGDYNIYVEERVFEKEEINSEIKIKIDSKKYNL